MFKLSFVIIIMLLQDGEPAGIRDIPKQGIG